MTQTFTGDGITYYQLAAIKQGLKACKIGMRVNQAYTPSKLRLTVENLCGGTYKSKDYDSMIAAVQKKMDELLAAKQAEQAEQGNNNPL